jgi:outer membrane protein assembly factor BamE (lipoprotein component of BamABCDE complex)
VFSGPKTYKKLFSVEVFMRFASLNIALVLAGLLLLPACSPIITTHGNMLPESKLKQVTPNVSTRADVMSYWGPPTTVSAFDNNTWYYIGETDSHKGVFAPEVEKRQMIKVTFDTDDKVTGVSIVDNKLAKNVDFVPRKTPTAGKEYTAAQQFIGDLGKFNKSDKKPKSGP